MEVSRHNFLEIFPEILQKLDDACFVSFDAEYTGLKANDGETATLFDTASQRYEVLRRVVMNNSAPQFGIAIFQRMYGPEYMTKQCYTIDAYCFYLAESCFGEFNMTTTKAAVDIDCCQFLNGINFDFDRWFKYSVPYLNQNKLKELENYLAKNPNPTYDILSIGDSTDEILRKSRGFSVIVDVISKRKLPVVGHNMALDLMYFFHQFCENLPENYDEFKSELAKYLPVIFDTKYMTIRCRKFLDHPAIQHAKQDIDQLQCSNLYVIYKTSSAVNDKYSPQYSLSTTCSSFIQALEIGKTKDLEDEENSPLCHEPSFDACVTGIVFLNLAHIACRISTTMFMNTEAPKFEEVLHFIRHWQDQVFVARATVMSMCLKGDDPRPNRSWVKVVSPGNKSFGMAEIKKELQSDPEMQRALLGIDYQQINPNEMILAVARVQSAYDLCEKLGKKGYEATRVFIPWNNKRYEAAENCKMDCIYDTRHKKFFS